MAQVSVINLLEDKQNPPKSYILNVMALDESSHFFARASEALVSI